MVTNTGNVTLLGQITVTDDKVDGHLPAVGGARAGTVADLHGARTRSRRPTSTRARSSNTRDRVQRRRDVAARYGDGRLRSQTPRLTVAKSSTTTSLSAPQTVTYTYLGHEHGQRDADRDRAQRRQRQQRHELPGDDAARRTAIDDVHGDAHVHAGGARRERLAGCGKRQADEHGDRDLERGARRRRDNLAIPIVQSPALTPREVGAPLSYEPGRPGDLVQLQGHEHRQRDAPGPVHGQRRQGDGDLSGRRRSSRARCVDHLHSVPHDHAGRSRLRPDRERRVGVERHRDLAAGTRAGQRRGAGRSSWS